MPSNRKAKAAAQRIDIWALLVEAGPNGLSVNDLASLLRVSRRKRPDLVVVLHRMYCQGAIDWLGVDTTGAPRYAAKEWDDGDG